MLAPDVKVNIGGRERLMRPTIKAMMAIEQELNCTSMSLVGRIMSGDIGARDVLCILYNGLNGTTDRLERPEIEVEMEANGLVSFIPVVTRFMEAHLSGKPSGKDQPDPSE